MTSNNKGRPETWKDLFRAQWWTLDRIISIGLLGGISLILGVVAITISFRTEYHTLRQIDSYIKDEVRGALTTHAVGRFPDNMDAIIELLEGANLHAARSDVQVEERSRWRDTIHVVCDMAAYGMYSFPEKYDRYRNLLINIASSGRPHRVRIQVYDDSLRGWQVDQQFGNCRDKMDSCRASAKYKRFTEYWSKQDWFSHIWDSLPAEPTYDQFKEWVLKVNRLEIVHFKQSRILVKEEQVRSNIFMWRRNKQEAIFSFYNNAVRYSPNEVSITTRDGKLIDGLIDQMPRLEESRQESQP